MPDFHEVRFPPDIAYGAVGGPEYRTTVVTTWAASSATAPGRRLAAFLLASVRRTRPQPTRQP
jgi:hypothetical protein